MPNHQPLRRAFFGVVALLVVQTAVAQGGSAQPKLERKLEIAVVGASVSAGFVCPWSDETGRANRTVKLKQALGALWDRSTVRIRDLSDTMTFLDPVGKQTTHAGRAAKKSPDLVVGIDFMFWFGYGQVGRFDGELERRLKRQKQGFALLEQFDCPIVVGDYPDMTGADPRMLPATAIPSQEGLKRLNEELHAWVEKHDNVTLFPLAEWVGKVREDGREVTVDGDKHTLHTDVLMQTDKLHASKLGMAVLADELGNVLRAKLEERLRPVEVEFVALVEHVRADLELEDALEAAEPLTNGAGK